MGVKCGPRIKRSNLVLYLDNYNVKSFKGIPVVNCIRDLTTWPTKARCTVTEITDGSIEPPIEGARVFKIEKTDATNAVLIRDGGGLYSSYNNSYVLTDHDSGYTSMGLGKYKYSAWVRGDVNNTGTTYVQIDIGDRGNVGTNVNNSSEWQRLETDDSNGLSNPTFDFFDIGITPNNCLNTVYVSGMMLARRIGTDPYTLSALTSHPQWVEIEDSRENTDIYLDLISDYPIAASSAVRLAANEPKIYFPDDSDNGAISLVVDAAAANDLNMGYSSISVEAWVYLESGSDQSTRGVFTHSANGGWSGYGIRFSSRNPAIEIYGETSGRQQKIVSSQINEDEWTHVTWVLDRSALEFRGYVNGVKVGTPQSFSEPGNVTYQNTNAYIGCSHSNYYRGIGGQIDMIKVYRGTLTDTEVLQNYNATKGRYR